MPLSSFSQTEIVLTRRPRMDRPLLWTVWLGTAMFSLAEGQWFYLLAATLAVTVNMLALRRDKEVYVHRLFVNIGVLCATGILAIEVISPNLTLLRALGHYLILLSLCKLFQHKTNRDYTQILALSTLLVLAAAMICNALWFAVLGVVYLALACHTAMVFTLKRGLDEVARSRLVTEPGPLEARRVAWNVIRSWPAGALRWCGAGIVVAALATGVAAFLVIPRSSEPADDLPLGGAGGAVPAGFQGTVELGDRTGRIYLSNAVLMHVRVERGGRAVRPAGPHRYLRGETFDVYRDSRWSKWHEQDWQWLDNQPAVPAQIAEQALGDALVQRVSMDASLLPDVFGSWPIVVLASQQGRAKWLSDLSVKLAAGPMSGRHVRYTAVSLPRPFSAGARRYLRLIRAQLAAKLPADPAATVQASRAVKDLAASWCADLLAERARRPEQADQINMQIARRIAENLKARYSYTLDLSGVDPSRDGVEDFLFHTRRGHCEYFASAMTVLCCTVGVRARLAAGFVMEEYDSANGYYIVRGRDAHAWTEVYTPGTDWVIVDATPPAGRQMHGRVWAASARRLWDQFQFMWYEKFIGYDSQARRQLWSAVKAGTADLVAALRASVRNLLAYGIVDRVLLDFAIIVGLAGLVVEAMLVGRWVRAARAVRAKLPVEPKKLRFIDRLTSLLEGAELRLRPDQTLMDFATRAAAARRLPVDRVRALVGLYYRTRWGGRVPTEAELRLAEREVDRLSEMSSAGPGA